MSRLILIIVALALVYGFIQAASNHEQETTENANRD